MATLNLNGDYATEVLSWYLWGQNSQPPRDKIADEKYIDRQESITLNIDPNQFLQKVGNVVNAKDFRLFETFFSGKTKGGNNLNADYINKEPINGEYSLTQEEFADLFYNDTDDIKDYNIAKNPRQHTATVSLYDRNLDNPEFAKLAFVFGSLEVGLDTSKIRYVLDENLNPLRVENVEFIINEKGDNFDFSGGEGSNEVNQILNQIADPSGIGRTVELNFNGGARLNSGIITANDYQNTQSLVATDLEWSDFIGGTYSIPSALLKKYGNYMLFLNEFNRIKSTGVIDYLDENGKLVIFGSDSNDILRDLQAMNLNFAESIKIDGLPDWLATQIFDLNHFEDYIDNGITYIGGDGDDRIVGTNNDDILIGNNGDDKLYGGDGADILEGGLGYDTYFVNNSDTIYDSDGNGVVSFDDNVLMGGIYNSDENAYLGFDGVSKYYFDENTQTLTVKSNDKQITINNFDINHKEKTGNDFLGISLIKGSEIIITQNANLINQSTKLYEFSVSLSQNLKDGEFIIVKTLNHTLLFGTAPDDIDTTGFITNGKFQAVFDGPENFVVEKMSNNILIKDLVFKCDNKEMNEQQNIIHNQFTRTLKLDGFLNTIEQTNQETATQNENTNSNNELNNEPNFANDNIYTYKSGKLEINEVSGYDKIVFDESITFAQIANYISKQNNDLILLLDGNNENSITIKDFFSSPNSVVEEFIFQSGGSIRAEQFYNLFGLNLDQSIDPTKLTYKELNLSQANTTINITGGNYSIYDEGGNDTIKFGSNFTADDVKFTKINDDLSIQYGQNYLMIKNQFNPNNTIENFELDDGSVLTSDQINKIIQEMYAYDKDTDNFSGFSFSDIQNQSNLQIYG